MKKIIVTLFVFLVFLHTAHAVEKWSEYKGNSFIVYYKNVPFDFVQTVLNSAEEDLLAVRQNLNTGRYDSWSWDKRASIYIYDDKQDYIDNAKAFAWSHGAAMAQTKTIYTFPEDSGFFDSLLPHELGHIVFYQLVGPSADVPTWFNEGVAMYQEKAKRLGAHSFVREAIQNGKFISLTDMMNMQLYNVSDRRVVETFYEESASVVYFMITELGEEHFYKFCRALKDGTPFERALTDVYLNLKGIDDLNKKWLNYLQEHR